MENLNMAIVNAEGGELEDPDVDPARKMSMNVSLVVGQGMRSLYAREFSKDQIRKISHIQMVMAGIICTLQLATMCFLAKYSALEVSGVGLWSSIIVILASKCVLCTCDNMTYRRLCLSLVMHGLAMFSSTLLLVLALGDSIPRQRYRLYEQDEVTYSYMHIRARETESGAIRVISLVLTTVIVFGGFVQFMLSFLIFWKSTSAICTRSYKMEFHKHLERKDTDPAQENPPPYEEISGTGQNQHSTL